MARHLALAVLLILLSTTAFSAPPCRDYLTAWPEHFVEMMAHFQAAPDVPRAQAVVKEMRALLKRHFALESVPQVNPFGGSPQLTILPAGPHRTAMLAGRLAAQGTELLLDTATLVTGGAMAIYTSSPRTLAIPWAEFLSPQFHSTTIHELVHHSIDMLELHKDHELAALRLRTRRLMHGDQFHFEEDGANGVYSYAGSATPGELTFQRVGYMHMKGPSPVTVPAEIFWNRLAVDMHSGLPSEPLVDLGDVPPRVSFFVGKDPLGLQTRARFHAVGLETIYLNGEFRMDEVTALVAEYLYLRHGAAAGADDTRMKQARDILALYLDTMAPLLHDAISTLAQGDRLVARAGLDVDRVITNGSAEDTSVGFSAVHLKLLRPDATTDPSQDRALIAAHILQPALAYLARVRALLRL